VLQESLFHPICQDYFDHGRLIGCGTNGNMFAAIPQNLQDLRALGCKLCSLSRAVGDAGMM
jgi:hypothetical protein